MFATQSNHKTGDIESQRAKTQPGRHAVETNSVWQSLALRSSAVQARLDLSQPGDPQEQEADRIADRVMQTGVPPELSITSERVKAQRKGPQSREQEAVEAAPLRTDQPGIPDTHRLEEPGLLTQQGEPLDAPTRSFFEPRFGQDFRNVRIHADAEAEDAARSVNARAFTHGSDIAFRAGQYSPLTNSGRQLLAHELAHVVQQQSAPPALGKPLARQTWGTANTTAPPAKNKSPGDVFRGRLKEEVALFANAGVILDWIVSERAAAGGATVTSFKMSLLFADAATMKRIKPVPATAADLVPALEMLEYYEVVKRKDPDTWDIVLAPLQPGQAQQDVNRAGFDQNRADISAFQQSFETRFDAQGHPIKQIAQQELLEDSLAGGAASEFQAQKDADTKLVAVTAELGEFVAFRKKGKPIFRVTSDSPPRVTAASGKTSVMLPIAGQKKPTPVDEADFDRIESIASGTSAEVETRRKDIEKRKKAAERALFNAQGFHRFAVEMVWFLHQLETTSTVKFRAGTYPRHGKFGEYAADMYPRIAENSAGFYKVDQAERFVDAINSVAEAGHTIWGKFAWQIVYNDTGLQATINAKYGARMSSAPHHGPAPDKLHMHLDIRPLNVVADPDTGYGINSSGRVSLY
jgi:hypothetical protein